MDKVITNTRKILIGIAGGVVVVIGLLLVPYPGPGWLIVFAGLAILSTEFKFAKQVLHFARGKYNAWVDWLRQQSWPMRILVLGATGIVVLFTLWLLNAFGLIVSFFNLPYEWLISPIFS